jgi:hypothetical protein
MRFLMETMDKMTPAIDMWVSYGSETPGIWLINWNITMHLEKSAALRRTHLRALRSECSPNGAAQQLAPYKEQVVGIA